MLFMKMLQDQSSKAPLSLIAALLVSLICFHGLGTYGYLQLDFTA